MTLPLMPKATAVWLVENTKLTFEQIGEFCGMHTLEVQGIADGEVSSGIIGKDPINSRQLSREEIERCEKDSGNKLRLLASTEVYIRDKKKQRKSRYTPIARRQDKPSAVAWLLKHCPDVTDVQITRLIGTTKNTISGVRNKTHWNYQNLAPRDPVLLGLCSQNDIDTLMNALKINKEKEEKRAAEELAKTSQITEDLSQDKASKQKNAQ